MNTTNKAKDRSDSPLALYVKKLQPRTMTALAADLIKVGIFSGEFSPGERLIPTELESRLNIGRVPIREAIKELAGSGLVKLHANRGAVVAPMLTPDELNEVFELRHDLEGKAVYLATQRITPEQLQYLKELNETSASTHDPLSYTQANRTFHLELYRTAGWNFLFKMITELYDQMLTVRSYFPTDINMAAEFTKEHNAILRAMSRYDAEEARRLVQKHISWLHAKLNKKNENKL